MEALVTDFSFSFLFTIESSVALLLVFKKINFIIIFVFFVISIFVLPKRYANYSFLF